MSHPACEDLKTQTYESKQHLPWWRTLEEYFKVHSLVEHQISSHDIFFQSKLKDILTKTNIRFTENDEPRVIKFSNVRVKKPEINELIDGINCKHPMMPNENRIKNTNYTVSIYIDIRTYFEDPDGSVADDANPIDRYDNVFLGQIPVMVMSKFCNLHGLSPIELVRENERSDEIGGYFIINGNEKVLMSQDRMAHNELFVFKSKEKDTIKITKIEPNNTISTKTVSSDWYAETRSHSFNCEPNITNTYIRLSVRNIKKSEKAKLYVDLPSVSAVIPWGVVCIALGMKDSQEALSFVFDVNDTDNSKMRTLISPSLEDFNDANGVLLTRDTAIGIISRHVGVGRIPQKEKERLYTETMKILETKLFQNLNERGMIAKYHHFGYMTQQLLATVVGIRHPDDRDHYGKKRVDTAGHLMNNLMNSIWKNVINDIIKKKFADNAKKSTGQDIKHFFYNKITKAIKNPFSNGEWVANKSQQKSVRSGVCQLLNSSNTTARLSSMRRVVTPSDRNSKIIDPRYLHNSHWGFICPNETPESQPTGLVKNIAIMSTITDSSPTRPILLLLENYKDAKLLGGFANQTKTIPWNTHPVKIIMNGTWIAVCKNKQKTLTYLRTQRRAGKISHTVSLSGTIDGIIIYTDSGRLITPFFIVKGGKLPDIPADITWYQMIDRGIIEYLDPMELQSVYHAEYPWKLDKKHTHSIIHPAILHGISASTIPFPNYNQSPRNIYQAAMGKQAIGIQSYNYNRQFENSSHILHYPQKPIVNSNIMRLAGSEDYPSGQNVIVAIMSGAYNQEDSVIVNQRAIDLGLLRSTHYASYSDSNSRKGQTVKSIGVPPSNATNYRVQGYNHLDSDGLSKENVPINMRDIVIGKYTNSHNNVTDTSKIVNSNGMEPDAVKFKECGDPDGPELPAHYAVTPGYSVIDRCVVTQTNESSKVAKVRTRQHRIPQIGDKVASRSAQKGIISMISDPMDLPFCEKTGITPDMIFNPHGIPSRMTGSHLSETVVAKVCAMMGIDYDATVFEHFNKVGIYKALEEMGFDKYGDDVMVNGITGERMDCMIFMGITYYQRLKHMVDDKIHARSQDGSRETLTRQPVEGRKKGGGFKMGEMETWCGVAHGASNFIIDRLVNNSDGYEFHVCDRCGNMAIPYKNMRINECNVCRQSEDISKIKIPYAFKLLKQEFNALGVGVWINVEK